MNNPVYTTPTQRLAQHARTANVSSLKQLLLRTRERTLSLLRDFELALGPKLEVPCEMGLNPPLWELGHLAWFQNWWVGRNAERQLATACNPHHQRLPCPWQRWDEVFNSSVIPHAARWTTPMLELAEVQDYLKAVLGLTLNCLNELDNTDPASPPNDAALYFYRWVVFHEMMHNEAWVMMAQSLGIPLTDPMLAHPPSGQGTQSALLIERCLVTLGHDAPGFAFDNECPPQTIEVKPFEVNSQPVQWGPFLDYLDATGDTLPNHLRRLNGIWEIHWLGSWQAIDRSGPAILLSAQAVQAYCDWAGLRLPTEAEWLAACNHPHFEWGRAWEWTASAFEPLPGFQPHPYVDYSQPWFGDRLVLKGGSVATDAAMIHTSYRNFFEPHRTDVFAGFRTVS